jgi:hypothetical protein
MEGERMVISSGSAGVDDELLANIPMAEELAVPVQSPQPPRVPAGVPWEALYIDEVFLELEVVEIVVLGAC